MTSSSSTSEDAAADCAHEELAIERATTAAREYLGPDFLLILCMVLGWCCSRQNVPRRRHPQPPGPAPTRSRPEIHKRGGCEVYAMGNSCSWWGKSSARISTALGNPPPSTPLYSITSTPNAASPVATSSNGLTIRRADGAWLIGADRRRPCGSETTTSVKAPIAKTTTTTMSTTPIKAQAQTKVNVGTTKIAAPKMAAKRPATTKATTKTR